MKRAFIAIGVLMAVFTVATTVFLVSTGFVVIQPIGAIPDGVTIWYWRGGIDLPFVSSPDGYSLEKTGELSLLSRLAAMAAIVNAVKDKIILRLPYMNSLYLISTGGKEFER